jgi:nucleoside-diphosphate-sugar epimerase
VPVATLRPFNTFGPRQSARAVIPTIVSQALTRDRVELGSLSPIRDLTYVSDTVEGFLRAAEAPEAVGDVINVGNGRGVTIGQLAERILSLMGKTIPIVAAEERVRPEKSEVFTLICDRTKAEKLLGWAPRVSLDDGLRAVIEFVDRHSARFKADIYNV